MTADDAPNETIVALSSGGLPSGIAVLRISGPLAAPALARLAGKLPVTRRATLARIRDAAGETIDRGIVLFFDGPGTATGEDLSEIHLHGGRAVVAACLAALTAIPGIRLAEAGEFTRRAFENGRIDLTEAEGLADLLSAETEAQRIESVARSGGALRTLYENWMRRLVEARAYLEASFDFADEGDVGDDVASGVSATLAALLGEMAAHLATAHRGEILRHGFRVAIVGAPNAGKSSLLNALAEREAAIVSDIPGTTRDVLEVFLDLSGAPVRLIDTAGIRDTEDTIEAMGIARAKAAAETADLVLLLQEPGQKPMTHVGRDGMPVLRVLSKSDLLDGNGFGPETFDMAVSTRDSIGLDSLVERISYLARDAIGKPSVIPMRVRHREIVAETMTLLEATRADQPAEVRADLMRLATDRLGTLTGRVGVEDLLDVIFSAFCIGK